MWLEISDFRPRTTVTASLNSVADRLSCGAMDGGVIASTQIEVNFSRTGCG